MYSIKKIETLEELEIFKSSYAESFASRSYIAKRELKNEELATSSQVLAIYKHNEMFAGFILNYYPKRCLEEFTKEEQEKIVASLGEKNICELVGIWKKSSEKNPLSTIFMWIVIISKTLMLGRSYIFGCNRSEKVGQEYYYKDDMQVIPNKYSNLLVFYYTRRQFFMTFVKSLFSFLKKKKKTSHKNAIPTVRTQI